MRSTTPAGRLTEEHYRFLCDEMLRKLGHWLRAAGYDTEIASEGDTDRSLLEKAVAEKRWLITRDRKMIEYRQATERVILLHSNDMQDCATELQARLSINWFLKPFSRCLLCNTPLTSADTARLEKIPPQSRASITQAFYCRHCDKLYWEGSHVRRLSNKFSRWMDA